MIQYKSNEHLNPHHHTVLFLGWARTRNRSILIHNTLIIIVAKITYAANQNVNMLHSHWFNICSVTE